MKRVVSHRYVGGDSSIDRRKVYNHGHSMATKEKTNQHCHNMQDKLQRETTPFFILHHTDYNRKTTAHLKSVNYKLETHLGHNRHSPEFNIIHRKSKLYISEKKPPLPSNMETTGGKKKACLDIHTVSRHNIPKKTEKFLV